MCERDNTLPFDPGIEDLRPLLESCDSVFGVDGKDRTAGAYRDLCMSTTGRADEATGRSRIEGW